MTDARASPDGKPDLRYWAFLSYSHHDRQIAKRLQRRLETYRLPRRLVGRETSEGPIPARASPVFRDRDELHAGADLKASVQDALSRSRWLIVVCTPDSARSPWVNREIIEFKRLRGERHVLALIARGEPFASDMPGREAEECFAPALRRALSEHGVPDGEALEPIAADMRRQGDGPQRATLKLLAGMVGVGFDDLVRRDMQRRVRWLSAIAGASVLGGVVFALMAVMAVQARNEAQHQRVQAEGLIEFMLGDLRKKLEPVGRLEVLDSVGEKALAYYGAQSADKLDATALGHRSRAMHLIGEIRDLRGAPAEAQAAFESAASTTARLLAQSPGDTRRLFDHAQSVFWVGYSAWKRTDGRMAEAKFLEYLELAQRLSKTDPSNADWQAEVAFAHVNLGMVQLGTGRPSVALQSLEMAGTLLSRLSAQRPELRFELAQNYGWRANAYQLLGDYENALAEQQEKLKIFQAMPDASKSKTAQRGLQNSLNVVSMYELALGRIDDAERHGRASLAIADRLIEDDPTNASWLSAACIVRLRMVETHLAMSRRAEAQREFAAAQACIDRLPAAATAGSGYVNVELRGRAFELASVLAAADQQPALIHDIETFLGASVQRREGDTYSQVRYAYGVAAAAAALGELYGPRDAQAAMAAWRRAEAALQPFAQMADGAVLTLLARICVHLGELPRAQSLADQIQRSSYRHPAYAVLVKELHAARGGGRTPETAGARP